MNTPLFSRTSVLILGVAAVAFSGLLHRLDLDENLRNAEALDVLSALRQEERPSNFAANPWQGYDERVYAKLQIHDSRLHAQHMEARDQIANWLLELSASTFHEETLVPDERFSPTPRSTGLLFTGADVETMAGKLSQQGPEPGRVTPFYLYEVLDPPVSELPATTVRALADEVERLTHRPTMRFIRSFEPPEVGEFIHEYLWRVDSVRSDDRQAVIRLLATPEQRSMQTQQVVQPVVREVHAQAESSEVASIAYGDIQLTAAHDSDASRVAGLMALSATPDRLRQLRLRYGELTVEDAQRIARAAIQENFQSVSVLGFSFSPWRLPPAVFVIFLVLQLVILDIVRMARARPGDSPEDAPTATLERAARDPRGQVIFWVVIPTAGLWAAWPGRFLYAWEPAAMAAFTVTLLVLGALCCVKARGIAPVRLKEERGPAD